MLESDFAKYGRNSQRIQIQQNCGFTHEGHAPRNESALTTGIATDRVLRIPMQSPIWSRRTALTALIGFAGMSALARSSMKLGENAKFIEEIERKVGGRIGLAALDTATGRWISYRSNERFSMASTFKLMLAAAILSRVDRGDLQLEQPVSFTRDEILPASPVGQAHPEGGSEPLSRMLQSIVEASDNTAANRLLALIGGPEGYTEYLRGIGDSKTSLDRTELELNSNLPGDSRDTTTPFAMAEDMQRVLVSNALSSTSRERLVEWMRNCPTGRDRLRARLPDGWEAGDKTGTGSRGAVNDLAILFPPNRSPILIACYMSDSHSPRETLNGAHAQIGTQLASIMA